MCLIAVLAFHLISSPYKDLYILENPYHWVEVLPLHMCDLSEIFLVWFFLGGPRNFKSSGDSRNLVQIFLMVIILKESPQEETITMHQN